MNALSVFDLDHTLLKGNSSFLFAYYLFKRRVLSVGKLLRLLVYYVRHKRFGYPQEKLHREALRGFLGGRSHRELKQLVDDFLNQTEGRLENQPAMQRLRQAQEAGHYTVILSNSPSFLVSAVARRLRVDEWHATEYATGSNEEFAGEVKSLEGIDKAFLSMGIASRLSIEPSAVTAYSDSVLDLPLLEVAGTAVGVNPDAPLRKICKTKGWEVLD